MPRYRDQPYSYSASIDVSPLTSSFFMPTFMVLFFNSSLCLAFDSNKKISTAHPYREARKQTRRDICSARNNFSFSRASDECETGFERTGLKLPPISRCNFVNGEGFARVDGQARLRAACEQRETRNFTKFGAKRLAARRETERRVRNTWHHVTKGVEVQ